MAITSAIDAVMLIEDGLTKAQEQAIEDDSAETRKQIVEAFQFLIDTGTVWKLQGWYGRAATQLIDQGLCHS